MAEQPIKRTTEEARAGESRGSMRWVLMVGTVLAVLALGWLAFSTSVTPQDADVTGPAPASATR